MKLLKSQPKDERIESIQNRIFKEMYYLIVAVCVISMAVKSFVYGLDVRAFATEIVIIVVPSVYYGIRTIILGIYGDELEMQERASKTPTELKSIIYGLAAGIGISLFFGIRNAIIYGDETTRLYYFGLVFLGCIMIYAPFFILIILVPNIMAKRISKKKTAKNEEQL